MKRLIAIAALAAGTMFAATAFADEPCSPTGFQVLGNGSIVPCNGYPSATNGRPWYQQEPLLKYYRNQGHHRHRHYDDEDYDSGPSFFFSFGQPHYYRR
jgi:hypothetical protein